MKWVRVIAACHCKSCWRWSCATLFFDCNPLCLFKSNLVRDVYRNPLYDWLRIDVWVAVLAICLLWCYVPFVITGVVTSTCQYREAVTLIICSCRFQNNSSCCIFILHSSATLPCAFPWCLFRFIKVTWKVKLLSLVCTGRSFFSLTKCTRIQQQVHSLWPVSSILQGYNHYVMKVICGSISTLI